MQCIFHTYHRAEVHRWSFKEIRFIKLNLSTDFLINQIIVHLINKTNNNNKKWTSAPAPSIQYHASNLDWWFISYMILYMFQCHSPKSSHPLPLPQSPKACSIHLCLVRIQGYRYHLSKFHIYVLVYCIGVFLSGLLHSV